MSPVPLDVQAVVLSSYLTRPCPSRRSCSRPRATTTSTGPATTASRWPAGCTASHGRPGASSTASSTDVDGVRFTVCPWWDGPLTRDEVDAQLAAAAVDRPDVVGVGLPLAAGRDGAVPRRPARVPGPRPGRLDRGAPARHRHLRPHPPGARGPRAARGTRGSAAPRCSTPASRSGTCRRTSPSTPRRAPPTGSACSTARRSTSADVGPAVSRLGSGDPCPPRWSVLVVVALGVARGPGARPRAPGGAPGCRGCGRPSPCGPRCRRTAA